MISLLSLKYYYPIYKGCRKNLYRCTLNTFVSLIRLPGVDIEMIHVPVQITQQRNHSNAKYYHKRTRPCAYKNNLTESSGAPDALRNHWPFSWSAITLSW